MLSGYDDVRQINVSCRTTKNAGIDTVSRNNAQHTHNAQLTNVAINTTIQQYNNTKIQNANTECKIKKQIVENRKNKIIRRKHNALTTPGNTQAQYT